MDRTKLVAALVGGTVMKTKKISIRTNGGWEQVENKSKTNCDRCGEQLWAGPGRTVYCNGNGVECKGK